MLSSACRTAGRLPRRALFRAYGGDTSVDTTGRGGEWPSKFDSAFTTTVLKDKLRNGEPLIGCLTNMYGDSSHIEILGMLGYDFLWVEAEHSSAGPSDCEPMYIAAERRGLPTITRIGENNVSAHAYKEFTMTCRMLLCLYSLH
jgi:hypothetical protein